VFGHGPRVTRPASVGGIARRVVGDGPCFSSRAGLIRGTEAATRRASGLIETIVETRTFLAGLEGLTLASAEWRAVARIGGPSRTGFRRTLRRNRTAGRWSFRCTPPC